MTLARSALPTVIVVALLVAICIAWYVMMGMALSSLR
jgi:hypothetical protein